MKCKRADSLLIPVLPTLANTHFHHLVPLYPLLPCIPSYWCSDMCWPLHSSFLCFTETVGFQIQRNPIFYKPWFWITVNKTLKKITPGLPLLYFFPKEREHSILCYCCLRDQPPLENTTFALFSEAWDPHILTFHRSFLGKELQGFSNKCLSKPHHPLIWVCYILF